VSVASIGDGPGAQARAFLRDLGKRLQNSDVFFMAGAISFNVLIAIVPLVLLLMGISGIVVRSISEREGRPTEEFLGVLLGYLPAIGGDIELARTVAGVVEGIIEERTGFSLIGAIILAWIATRLVGTLRVVLRNIFEAPEQRGIVAGKLFDLKVVALGGVLILLNVLVTIVARTFQAFGVDILGVDGPGPVVLRWALGPLLGFISAWLLFLLLYRYVPARTLAWRTAIVGATFTAVFYELMKEGFAWYVTSFANFGNAYGSLAVAAVLFFWIYYGAVVFIVGGLVSRSFELWRESRMKAVMNRKSDIAGILPLFLICAGLFAGHGGLSAQAVLFGTNGGGANGGLLNGGDPVLMADRSLEREMVVNTPLVDHDGPYVLVHIAESRVFVLEGREVIWSAPAGTGNGFELEGQGQEWTFTTPVGMFQVLRKEKNPVWIVPDWWYVQRGWTIPPREDPSRYMENTLGTSALYLGDGIAIHGTDKPEYLMPTDPDARRVSHGCIRLTNEAARQLYHFVDVGTPVVIF